MRPLHIGILGTGDGARNHVTGLDGFPADLAVLHSVCGRDPDRTGAFAVLADVPAAGVYVGQAAFLADPDLDAVIVATPDASHMEHAFAAMRAGKHVLVEKPMGLTARDAEDMARLAQHCAVRLGVGFHLRHHAGHRRLRDELAKNAIGTVSHVHVEWTTRSMGADNWRATSTEGWWALAALGSHALDLVAWLTGSDRANVFATKGASATGRDERVAMHLELERGVTASIRVSVADAPVKYLRVSGSDGVVECHNTLGGRGTGEIILPDGARLGFHPVSPYAAQLRAFAVAVREGRDPDAGPRDGILNVRWLEQAGDSMNVSL